jgi:hypothetical protein
LQALDTIMSQVLRNAMFFTTVGRSFFSNQGKVLDVGFGKEVLLQN